MTECFSFTPPEATKDSGPAATADNVDTNDVSNAGSLLASSHGNARIIAGSLGGWSLETPHSSTKLDAISRKTGTAS